MSRQQEQSKLHQATKRSQTQVTTIFVTNARLINGWNVQTTGTVQITQAAKKKKRSEGKSIENKNKGEKTSNKTKKNMAYVTEQQINQDSSLE